MIKGMHGLFYTPEAEAARAFFRDKLELPFVNAHDGSQEASPDKWLIFSAPKAEFGIHPGDVPKHELSFWCDDLKATMAELRVKGVEFTSEVQDQGYGLVTTFELPGGVPVILYEPRHAQP